jgi:hypothetical protein
MGQNACISSNTSTINLHCHTHTLPRNVTALAAGAHLGVGDDVNSILRGVRVDALTHLQVRREEKREEKMR